MHCKHGLEMKRRNGEITEDLRAKVIVTKYEEKSCKLWSQEKSKKLKLELLVARTG